VKGMISNLDLELQTLVISSPEIPEIESILESFIVIKDGSFIRMADV
jgi:ABC-2 type transport system ATP-binding protein